MARVTPEQMASRWAQRLGGATEAITAGVRGVTVAPGQAAARQRAAWLARVQQSADKWATNVARVSLAEWQQKMLDVGVPRIAQGAQANQDKMARFAQEFLPHLDRGVAQVKGMPKVTLEDSVNRAVAMIRHNASFRRGGSSGSGR